MSKKNEANVEVIENASPDGIQAGDHVVSEGTRTWCGVTINVRREGTAHHRDAHGNWQTADGAYLTDGGSDEATITIRRPLTEEG